LEPSVDAEVAGSGAGADGAGGGGGGAATVGVRTVGVAVLGVDAVTLGSGGVVMVGVETVGVGNGGVVTVGVVIVGLVIDSPSTAKDGPAAVARPPTPRAQARTILRPQCTSRLERIPSRRSFFRNRPVNGS
jgi:hypothetical protein